VIGVWCGPSTAQTSSLSLRDALPILVAEGCDQDTLVSHRHRHRLEGEVDDRGYQEEPGGVVADTDHPDQGEDDRDQDTHREEEADRKSTRLNSSHVKISYAVFCLKKK